VILAIRQLPRDSNVLRTVFLSLIGPWETHRRAVRPKLSAERPFSVRFIARVSLIPIPGHTVPSLLPRARSLCHAALQTWVMHVGSPAKLVKGGITGERMGCDRSYHARPPIVATNVAEDPGSHGEVCAILRSLDCLTHEVVSRRSDADAAG
jgi:hypothetical protein